MTAAVPSVENLDAFRKGALVHSRPALQKPEWIRRTVPGRGDAPEVPILIVNSGQRDTARPVILHMHGGGFIIGTAMSSLASLQQLALDLDCVAISVDYRLAPETRFPGSLEDNYCALKWAHGHAHEIGGDPDRIALLGESAGGGHAAMLAIAARDRGEIPVLFQALVYPMLDDRTGSSQLKPPFMGAIIWSAAHNRFGWSSLLGAPAGGRTAPYGAVPARVENLAGLPPTFIGVGSIDLFADEDVTYVKRLMDAGVATELHVIPGAFHGFDDIPGTTIGPKFRADLTLALQQAFVTPR